MSTWLEILIGVVLLLIVVLAVGGVIGTQHTLLFTAGPDDESHGLFGELTPSRRHGHH